MQTWVLHKHTAHTYIYSYIPWIEMLVQVSTQDGLSHKSTNYAQLLQYKNSVIHIHYSNVIVNPLHTVGNRKLESQSWYSDEAMDWMTWALNPINDKRCSFSSNCPDWLCNPLSLLVSRFFCKYKVAWVWC
jgi:hypothetical protein